ncbi:hypothetical protein KAFR_0G03230 [Kazachstania africana CBS 2517]|uniref:SYO1-like TPR repeats domain-containing protein n=1 Tax=Kazachstania africana (strain ATCC 22294 / BCRC 22015 / CBS 2517 / CECT 1963 / NBRC 1671 / NRRL Y-8276) TaxID=1071382 RepID=H2AYA5_KAZAF|nr:hypothetical protein KAFR_0G03230 [Kazachstania africana CBS 2517]CCF59355.1 hypothetical protein KAFR_0G03230 [Kazachstania africana CBS 2517]
MGKSKKRSRASRARLNPLSNQRTNSAKDANLITKKIQPLITQLQSTIANDRNMAISSISVMCEDPHMRHLLMKEKLIHIILNNLLNDNNTDIVIEAFGLLRNLTIEEGYDVAVHLWRNDIWAHLKEGFNKINQSLDAMGKNENDDNKKASKQSIRMLFDYSDNLISLLVALTNDSDDILNEILKEDKLNVVFSTILKFNEYGMDKLTTNLRNTVLDFFYDFSSESIDFVEFVLNNEALVQLVSSLCSSEMNNELSQVLVCGINLQFADVDTNITLDSSKCNEILTQVTQAIGRINLQDMKQNLNFAIDNSETIDASRLKDYAKKKQAAMMELQAIETGIDVLTGIFEMIASLQINVDLDLMTVLKSNLPNFLNSLLAEFPDRILIAWNNYLWLFVSLGGEEITSQDLSLLWQHVVNIDDKNENSIKSGKLSVMWVLLKICGLRGDIETLTRLQVWNNIQFITSVIDEFKKTDDIEVRQKCCGLLACVACYQGQDVEMNQTVGTFFLECLVSTELQVDILVDVTNFIFEVYSDADFDYDEPVFINGNFLAVLKDKVAPNLKNRFKMVDKNKDPEVKSRCTECCNTLDSFIHYKSNERS